LRPPRRFSLLPLLLAAAPVAASAQQTGDLASFLAAVEAARSRLAHVETATAEGYRRLGPDFPGMGEHWIQPGLVIAGKLDPAHPPVVSYASIGGERRLIGFAFTRVLGPDDRPAEDGPIPRHAWHDHSASVDEESLLLSGPASEHSGGHGYRLAMVHVWIPLANPDGVLAQNNWALPFVRAGLTPPEAASSRAARILSLTGAGMKYYEDLLSRQLGTREADLSKAVAGFRSAGTGVEAWLETRSADPTVTGDDLAALEEMWQGLWDRLERNLSPDAFEALELLRS